MAGCIIGVTWDLDGISSRYRQKGREPDSEALHDDAARVLLLGGLIECLTLH